MKTFDDVFLSVQAEFYDENFEIEATFDQSNTIRVDAC
jgi:hypothetical protein